MLLDAGAFLESADMAGMTPLHVAASLGDADIATLLLQRGAQVEARDRQGRTPFLVAAVNAQRCVCICGCVLVYTCVVYGVVRGMSHQPHPTKPPLRTPKCVLYKCTCETSLS
jgi:hypothetical protein